MLIIIMAIKRCRLAVDGLEQARAEEAVIDHIAPDAHADFVAAVDLAAPVAGAERVEVIGVLVFQQRLGFAVAALLLEVRLDRVAAVMPDLGRRAKSRWCSRGPATAR